MILVGTTSRLCACRGTGRAADRRARRRQAPPRRTRVCRWHRRAGLAAAAGAQFRTSPIHRRSTAPGPVAEYTDRRRCASSCGQPAAPSSLRGGNWSSPRASHAAGVGDGFTGNMTVKQHPCGRHPGSTAGEQRGRCGRRFHGKRDGETNVPAGGTRGPPRVSSVVRAGGFHGKHDGETTSLREALGSTAGEQRARGGRFHGKHDGETTTSLREALGPTAGEQRARVEAVSRKRDGQRPWREVSKGTPRASNAVRLRGKRFRGT
jgi:hypothetical protein